MILMFDFRVIIDIIDHFDAQSIKEAPFLG